MPISTISQTISTIPEAGHRGVDVQTVFVNKQEDFQDHLQGTTVTELNALKTQINTTVSGMNDAVININIKASEADADALSASNSASTAATKAGEASTSAGQALASKNKASQWADNDYNVEVETGKYSAKHWAIVAQSTDISSKVDKNMSGYTAKTTPISTDLLALSDSESSFNIKKISIEDLENEILKDSVLTGEPTAPTPIEGDNSKKIATTEFVQNNAGSISIPTAYNIYNGSVEVTNTVITNGFSTTLYTGNGGTQSITTNVDMNTQWGNDASEKFGGLIWGKSRSNAISNCLFDTIRGTLSRIESNTTSAQASGYGVSSFNSDGFSLSSSADLNTNLATYASWNFQTTHRTSGTTNHGKAYTCHYNPYTGFTIVKYEGSGIAGHEIPHHLGRKLGFVTTKNLSGANDWCTYYGEDYKSVYLNLTNATSVGTGTWNSIDDNISVVPYVNTSTNQYIMYGWADSYFDESNKLIGNYEIGVYQGTGAAGNKVITRGKPAWVMIKRLDSAGSWWIQDNIRTGGRNLYANLSAAEDVSAAYEFIISQDGFSTPHTNSDVNASGGQYLYMVVYDNDSGSGKSKYPKATDTSNLSINALVPYANGIDTKGSKVSISYKNETISGITLTQGKNYVYSKNDGTYGVNSIAPKYNDFSSIGDVFDTNKHKWFGVTALPDGNTNQSVSDLIPVMSADVYNGFTVSASTTYSGQPAYLSFDGSNSTGWVTAGIPTGWLNIELPQPKVVNKYSLVNFSTFVTRMPKTWTLQASNTGIFSGEQVTLDTRVNIVWSDLVKQYFTFSNANAYKHYRIVVTANNGDATYLAIGEMELIEATLQSAEISPRNYLDCVVYADHNGQVSYKEELPKIEYKDIVKANEFQGKNACTAWVSFDGTTTPPTIRDSYNVSSVVRTATGQFDVYFGEPMDSTNYAANYSTSNGVIGIVKNVSPTINKIQVQAYSGGTLYNVPYNDVQIFGGKNS